MMTSRILSVLLLQSLFALVVRATIYITKPLPGSTCSGGNSCTVEWLDDGVQPLLTEISACHVGLYNGNGVLIQRIDPVDVSAQHALKFTPDPQAGPNSGLYYINFTSVNDVLGDTNYRQFSTMFTLNSMSGSFDSPVPSDTSEIPIPSTLTASKTSSSSAAPVPTPSASSSSSSSGALAPSSTDTAAPSSSSGTSSSSSSQQTAPSSSPTSTLSRFITSSTGTGSAEFVPQTTLTVPPASFTGTGSATTVPAAPSLPSTPSSADNHASRTAAGAMPLILSSIIAFAFGLL
ncbi:hypothetical protein C8Q74DRAFT_1279174 [Fomes fomentarius]|nr:hypothetical protein C8Q74DRAFT_1279174 [Fomes fomentarius]